MILEPYDNRSDLDIEEVDAISLNKRNFSELASPTLGETSSVTMKRRKLATTTTSSSEEIAARRLTTKDEIETAIPHITYHKNFIPIVLAEKLLGHLAQNTESEVKESMAELAILHDLVTTTVGKLDKTRYNLSVTQGTISAREESYKHRVAATFFLGPSTLEARTKDRNLTLSFQVSSNTLIVKHDQFQKELEYRVAPGSAMLAINFVSCYRSAQFTCVECGGNEMVMVRCYGGSGFEGGWYCCCCGGAVRQ